MFPFVGMGLNKSPNKRVEHSARQDECESGGSLPPPRLKVNRLFPAAPPESRRLYLERIGQLSTNLFRVEALTNRVDELVARLRPQLLAYDTNLAQELSTHAQLLKGRLISRSTALGKKFEALGR
jgi:hypothetical protein